MTKPFLRCPVCGHKITCSRAELLAEALRLHMLNHQPTGKGKENDNV